MASVWWTHSHRGLNFVYCFLLVFFFFFIFVPLNKFWCGFKCYQLLLETFTKWQRHSSHHKLIKRNDIHSSNETKPCLRPTVPSSTKPRSNTTYNSRCSQKRIRKKATRKWSREDLSKEWGLSTEHTTVLSPISHTATIDGTSSFHQTPIFKRNKTKHKTNRLVPSRTARVLFPQNKTCRPRMTNRSKERKTKRPEVGKKKKSLGFREEK